MTLLAILLGAVLIEAVVESFRRVYEKNLDWKYVTALVVGVLVAVVFQLDVFEAVGLVAIVPYVGNVLTGVIAARGANYVSDLIGLINGLGIGG